MLNNARIERQSSPSPNHLSEYILDEVAKACDATRRTSANQPFRRRLFLNVKTHFHEYSLRDTARHCLSPSTSSIVCFCDNCSRAHQTSSTLERRVCHACAPRVPHVCHTCATRVPLYFVGSSERWHGQSHHLIKRKERFNPSRALFRTSHKIQWHTCGTRVAHAGHTCGTRAAHVERMGPRRRTHNRHQSQDTRMLNCCGSGACCEITCGKAAVVTRYAQVSLPAGCKASG